MGDELNDNTNITGEFRKRRPVPVPLYDDRYIERPYLKKFELAKIRDNLDELVEIKEELVNKNFDKNVDKKIEDFKNNVPTISPPVIEIKNPEIIKDEINKGEVKIGISNLSHVDDIKKIDIVKSDLTKPNNQIINKQTKVKKKVYKMSDENIDIESAFEKISSRKDAEKTMRESAELARQNRIDLANLKSELAKENERIKNELKTEFGSKFNEFGGKFGELTGKFENVNGKFDDVSKKLEETCTGIDCLKKDFANISKNMDLFECESCGEKVVPAYASYCPKCSAKQKWYEDDGVTPLKGWKPSWEK